MNNCKDDMYYINKILNNLHFIQKNMKGVNIEILQKNEILLDSMLFRLIQIQEDARKLSIELKMKYDNVPWFLISGIRNRIVHDYGNIDLRIVFNTLTNDVDDIMDVFKCVKL